MYTVLPKVGLKWHFLHVFANVDFFDENVQKCLATSLWTWRSKIVKTPPTKQLLRIPTKVFSGVARKTVLNKNVECGDCIHNLPVF